MITLTLDKLTLVNAGFSVKDPVHQGPGRSTPRHIACPGDFAQLEKAAQRCTGLYCMMGHDLLGGPVPSPINYSS
jgi:hypothetical protein